jgi:hypothetical protein
MMDVIFWINVIVLAATAILFGVNIRQMVSFRSKVREQTEVVKSLETKEREVEARLERVATLDMLLTRLCAESYHRTTFPTWRAWVGTMGDVKVGVEFQRYSVMEDDE